MNKQPQERSEHSFNSIFPFCNIFNRVNQQCRLIAITSDLQVGD